MKMRTVGLMSFLDWVPRLPSLDIQIFSKRRIPGLAITAATQEHGHLLNHPLFPVVDHMARAFSTQQMTPEERVQHQV